MPSYADPAAGLTCAPFDYSLANYAKINASSCTWLVGVKDGKFVVLNKGKPVTGKLVGDPALLSQYETGASDAPTSTTSSAPSS